MPQSDHEAQTQTTGAIHPAAWVAASDPIEAHGAHKLWIDTSSGPPYQLKKRNAGNTAWENVGVVNAVTDPTNTRGSFIVRGASDLVELAIGANQTILTSNGTDPSWTATPTVSGLLTAAGLKTSGVTGATSATALMGRTVSGAPVTGSFEIGNIVSDSVGSLWVCTETGTPGTWVEVSGSGGGGGGGSGGDFSASNTLVPIQAFGPLSGSQATFSFTVPVGYRNLQLVVIGRSTGAVTRTQGTIQFNGDTTAANYISQLQDSTTVTTSSQAFTSTAGAVFGQLPGTSATNTARPAAFRVNIPNYIGTTWQKALHSTGVHHDGSTLTMTQTAVAHWLNTAAIATMTVGLVSGSFEIGSYACLYGERDSVAPSAGALDVASVFQRTQIDGTGTITTTSTSFIVIDNTDLPAKTIYLQGGDLVRLTFQGQMYMSGSGLVAIDFQAVQPTSGTVRVTANAECGAGVHQGTNRTGVHISTVFTAIESGIHTFQPMWRVNAGTVTLGNASSGNDDSMALFMVEKLGALQIPYFHVQDQQSSGTAGGTFTSGAWQTRVLNTEVIDTHGLLTLASNQLPLTAGTYRVSGSGSANQCGLHQMRIQDITNAATLVTGLNAYEHAASSEAGHAHVSGRFTLAAAATIELQHRCGTTKSTDGFGLATSWGTEVYANLELWKEA